MELRKKRMTRRPAASDDEKSFWERWPKASRYFPPDERAKYETQYQGWYPGCNLNDLIPMVFPSESERVDARKAIIEMAQKVGQ